MKRSAIEFERGIGAAESHACGPARVIQVTAAVRAADDRRRAEQSNPGSEWRRSLGLRPAVEVERRVHTMHIQQQPKRRSLQ